MFHLSHYLKAKTTSRAPRRVALKQAALLLAGVACLGALGSAIPADVAHAGSPRAPSVLHSTHSATVTHKAGTDFSSPSRAQLRGLRAAWRADTSGSLGAVEDVYAFYVARGPGATSRFAVGCVDRAGYDAVWGRVLRRVGSRGNRWRAVSSFNTENVEADGEIRTAEDVIPSAAYEGLQNAIRSCGREQGIPYFYPGAEDQAAGEDEE